MMNRNYDPFVTKVFSLLKHLHMKYGFSLVNSEIPRYVAMNEYWIKNPNDPNYQLMRITNKTASEFRNEEHRIRMIIENYNREMGKQISFLDIHVCDAAYDPSLEEFDHLNIEYEFYNGVDVHEIYPEIYSALKDKDEANTVGYAIKEGFALRRAKRKKEYTAFKTCPITYIVIIICFIVYLFEALLIRRYDNASAYIILGADYKTFTLGLKQYYRLFTCAFLHGSFLHLISNMYSLFVVGHSVERILGRKKYALLLGVSILISSLTQGIMTENSLLIGMSGGVYGLFTYLLMWLASKGQLRIGVLLPTILLNVYLNFLSTTAWLAHIGGIVAGMIIFQVCNSNQKAAPISMLMVVIVFMLFKYLTLKQINPFFQATDMEVANIYYQWGLKDYSLDLMARLLKVYSIYGG